MAVAKKKCRVCGESYSACKSTGKELGLFVWREVACSPECGGEYLKQITDSRTKAGSRDSFENKPAINSAKPSGKQRPKGRRKKAEPETMERMANPESPEGAPDSVGVLAQCVKEEVSAEIFGE